MPLDQEAAATIQRMVHAGFWSTQEIVTILTEEVYAPVELERDEVEAAVIAAQDAHDVEMQTWPVVTDCDRLREAFRALNAQGVLALENAGLDQSDGYDEFRSALAADHDQQRVVGYCFYHRQDVESALDGYGLYLAHGPRDPRDERTKGSAVGQMVIEELKAAGLAPSWNGDFRQRIHIPTFDWKRR